MMKEPSEATIRIAERIGIFSENMPEIELRMGGLDAVLEYLNISVKVAMDMLGEERFGDKYAYGFFCAGWAAHREFGAPKKMEFTRSNRGFKAMTPIETDRKEIVELYESSLAEEPCVWLSVRVPPAGVYENTVEERGHAHMTLEEAKQLRDQLSWLIENHYQLETDDDFGYAAD